MTPSSVILQRVWLHGVWCCTESDSALKSRYFKQGNMHGVPAKNTHLLCKILPTNDKLFFYKFTFFFYFSVFPWIWGALSLLLSSSCFFYVILAACNFISSMCIVHSSHDAHQPSNYVNQAVNSYSMQKMVLSTSNWKPDPSHSYHLMNSLSILCTLDTHRNARECLSSHILHSSWLFGLFKKGKNHLDLKC